jgi:hypothetical protein
MHPFSRTSIATCTFAIFRACVAHFSIKSSLHIPLSMLGRNTQGSWLSPYPVPPNHPPTSRECLLYGGPVRATMCGDAVECMGADPWKLPRLQHVFFFAFCFSRFVCMHPLVGPSLRLFLIFCLPRMSPTAVHAFLVGMCVRRHRWRCPVVRV